VSALVPAAVVGLQSSRLRLPAAARPCVLRRDRTYDGDPALDPGDVLRLSCAARRGVRGALLVEIDGPGDPLASAATTLRALALLRDHEPSVLPGLVVDGLLVAEYADELVDLGLHHLVVRMDAVTPSVARRVVSHVVHRGETFDGSEAARLVLEEGRRALRVARWHRIPVAVRFTAIPAVNLEEAGRVAALCADEGVDRVDVVPHAPKAGAPLAWAGVPTRGEMAECRAAVCAHLPAAEMRGGRLGRLDPARLVELALDDVERLDERAPPPARFEPDPGPILPARKAQVVAVASTDGEIVDRALADAGRLRIYAVGEEGLRWVGTRTLAASFPRRHDGVGSAPELLAALAGCRAVVATRFTPRAATLLDAVGIRAHAAVGPVDEVLDRVARGTLR
jgi:hypothetical protein